MMQKILLTCAALALLGCAGLPTQDPVEAAVAEAAGPEETVALDPTDTPVDPDAEQPPKKRKGIFGGIFAPAPSEDQTEAPEQPTAPVAEDTTVAADPLAAPEAEPAPVKMEPTKRPRILGGIFRRKQTEDPAPAAVEEPIETPVEEAPKEAAEPVQETAPQPVEAEEPEPRKRGVFGGLFKRKPQPKEDPAPTPPAIEGDTETPAPVDPTVTPAPPEPPKRTGIFGRRKPAEPEDPAAGNQRDSAEGTLAFGEIRKVCNLASRKRGSKVDSAAGFTLYDTSLNSTGLRTYFVTGFKDKCARKFTAAYATFGDPLLHEHMQSRRKPPQNTKVDREYEVIKARICRTKALKKCEKNQKKLIRTTVFLSIYKVFGNSSARGEALLHRGKLVASHFR